MPPRPITGNTLFYGDNLEVLRKYVPDESIDLCYIDPPFNSKRNYNQIYNNIGGEDRAQAQAFVDTWVWDQHADEALSEILSNAQGRYSIQTIDLIKGLRPVLKQGSLLAYLVSMTLRIAEIHRVLKPTGSFYLHCDPTAGHYIKLVLDTIFVANGGEFLNEIVWHYKSFHGNVKNYFPRKHDTIFFYTKSNKWKFVRQFNDENEDTIDYKRWNAYLVDGYKILGANMPMQDTRFVRFYKRWVRENGREPNPDDIVYEVVGQARDTVWDIKPVDPKASDRLYPTQKPEPLLERIILASTNENDVVLDAYCGCGTTVVVAERLKRKWIGIDITYQSISLVLRRLEEKYGQVVLKDITLNGIPRDMDSARALVQKKDDRLRKEFEKWAVLTYSSNRAVINDKKGGDQGIDGTGYFITNITGDTAKIVFQVKSGNVSRGDISKFNNDRLREGAELGFFLTLQPSTKGMRDEATAAGIYKHELMNRSYSRIQIVTISEMVEHNKRLDIPMSLDVLKKAQAVADAAMQPKLFTDDE